MYAASGLLAVEYCEIRLKKVIVICSNLLLVNMWHDILRLTLKQTGNQDHRTISMYSCQKAPSWTNSLYCSNHIRWINLFLCSFQGRMWICVSTLKILSIGNFRHRNLKNIFLKGQKKTTYEWHTLSSDQEKHSKTLGVGSWKVLHAG